MVFNQLRKYTKALVIVVVLAFVGTLLFVGGTLPRAFGAGPVAAVNGVKLDRNEFNNTYLAYVSQMEAQGQSIPQIRAEGVQAALVNQWIDYQLMLQGAKKAGLKVTSKELKDQMNLHIKQYGSEKNMKELLKSQNISWGQYQDALRNNLLLQKFYLKMAGNEVTDQEARESLRQVRSRHILITVPAGKDGDQKAKAKAEQVLAELKAGKDFATLAKLYSDDTQSKAQGGELGFVSKGMLVKPFEDAIFSMKKGEIRGPVKTEYGYHVIQVEEIKDVSDADFAKVKDQAKINLANDKLDKALTSWLAEQRKKAKINVYDNKLAASLAASTGKYAEAIKLYEKAIKDEPKDAYIHVTLGATYQANKNLDKALAEYQKAVAMAPKDSDIQLMLAQAYEEKKMTNEAVAAYQKAGEMEPNNLGLHENLAQIFARLGRQDLMGQEMQKADALQKALDSAQKAQQDAAGQGTQGQTKSQTQAPASANP